MVGILILIEMSDLKMLSDLGLHSSDHHINFKEGKMQKKMIWCSKVKMGGLMDSQQC